MVGASFMGRKGKRRKWLLNTNKISNSTTKEATMLLLSVAVGSTELIQRWDHLFSLGNVNIGGMSAIVHVIRLIVGSIFWNPRCRDYLAVPLFKSYMRTGDTIVSAIQFRTI